MKDPAMRMSLQLRAAILVCSAVVSIVIGRSLLDLRSNALEREATMAARLFAVTKMQGSALTRPLWDFNLDQVKTILGTFGDESGFVRAKVVGADGKTAAERVSADRNPGEPVADGIWTFEVPIVFTEGTRKEPLGRLQAVFSKQALHAAFLTDVIHNLEATAVVGMVTMLAVLICLRMIAQKLKGVFTAMERLVSGDLSTPIPGLDRSDEIGAIARAIAVFKETTIEKRRMEERTLVASAQQAAVVDALAFGLAQLAGGNLTCVLSHQFGAEYERLGTDFNRAVSQLRNAMGMITDNTQAIFAGGHEITLAADDLCLRTQRHAVSLEETSASMSLLSKNVKQTSAGAARARTLVSEVKKEADHSGTVVTHAVEAMGRIKTASSQITHIVEVIDGLTTRTNLLALNATIEAARAGEAGLGFSVVAMEVRVLARQCSKAADKIKDLISASTVEVESGVALVGKTGVALTKIATMIAEVDAVVHDISEASREQAEGLADINAAVGEMDDVTQKNAAMIEEVTASAHGLNREMESLKGMVGRFRIDDPNAKARERENAARAAQAMTSVSRREVGSEEIASRRLRAS
jgi:methyl-accepting chemotaxis protein